MIITKSSHKDEIRLCAFELVDQQEAKIKDLHDKQVARKDDHLLSDAFLLNPFKSSTNKKGLTQVSPLFPIAIGCQPVKD